MLDLDEGVSVQGSQVLGAQGSALADLPPSVAADLATLLSDHNTLVTSFNQVLAMLRTHGLIASV